MFAIFEGPGGEGEEAERPIRQPLDTARRNSRKKNKKNKKEEEEEGRGGGPSCLFHSVVSQVSDWK